MKQSLFNLSVAILTLFCGIFTVEVFRIDQKPIPTFPMDKEIFEVPLVEKLSISETVDSEFLEYINEKTIHAWYSLDSYKGMPEVAMINFYGANFDDDGNNLGKMFFYAGVYTHLFKGDVDEGFAEAIETTVTGNKLKFRTKKLKGIEYRFQGVFFKNKMTGEQDEKVLRGSLQKFVKGKKVAEVRGSFEYDEPYCLY